MANNTVFFPGYSAGENAYKEIDKVCSPYGTKAVVISDEISINATKKYLDEATQDGIVKIDYILFPGEASFEAVDDLEQNEIVKNADMIFSVLERPGGPGLSGIYEAEKEYCLAGWSTETQLPPEQLELIFAHHFGGMFSMLRAWWKAGFSVETETFKELLENSGMFGLYHFVYTV